MTALCYGHFATKSYLVLAVGRRSCLTLAVGRRKFLRRPCGGVGYVLPCLRLPYGGVACVSACVTDLPPFFLMPVINPLSGEE